MSFFGVLCVFFLAENPYFESQTKSKLNNYPRIKKSVRRATKIRSIRTANESFNCNGVLLFAPRKFFLKT